MFIDSQRRCGLPTLMSSTILCLCLLLLHHQTHPVKAQERLVSEKYFGSLIGSFPPGQPTLGQVYAVDEFTIFIRSFTFAGGNYPLAYFMVGLTPFPDGSGFIVPDERGSTRPLGDYQEKDIVLRLPEGRSLKEVRWLSVWSRQLHTNLGHVLIPTSLNIPTPIELPPLTGLAHGVRSGPITIADAQTLLVTDFWYDGLGPAGYWWVSRGPRQSPQGLRLKDEKGTPNPLRAYRGEAVLITLPDAKTIYDFDWFGVWCEEFQVDFGHVQLPQHLRVPPSPRMLGLKPETKLNCEVLDDSRGFEARWIMDGDDIVMQLVARLQPREYMAFGLGKDDSRSLMTSADAVVAWIDHLGNGHAVDYFLGSKEQCVGTRGSCPDTKHPGASDSIILLHAAVINGFSMVTFKRPQLGVDEIYDQHIYSDGQQAIMWAVGPLNERNEVSYHTGHSYGDRFVDFARTPTWNCPRPDESLLNQRKWQRLIAAATSNAAHTASITRAPVKVSRANGNATVVNNSTNTITATPMTSSPPSSPNKTSSSSSSSSSSSALSVEPWQIPRLKCPKERTFWAQIGPTGGARGYLGITGRQGWGIAWYINGLLIPELVLQRGVTYTFFVEGGNDELNGARRHPLYLTDSAEGGYEYKTAAERKKEHVFAGVGLSPNGTVRPTAEGRLCEWKITPATNVDDIDGAYSTFKQFQSTLLLDCDPKHRPGMFKFTPDRSTPDTIYYQCYTHRYLGWKIRIVDSCESEANNVRLQPSASIVSSIRAAPPPNLKVEFEPREKGKPKMKPNSKMPEIKRGKPFPPPNYHHHHPDFSHHRPPQHKQQQHPVSHPGQLHQPKQPQPIEYEVNLPIVMPNKRPAPVFDPNNEDDISPYGPLINGFGDYGPHSFAPIIAPSAIQPMAPVPAMTNFYPQPPKQAAQTGPARSSNVYKSAVSSSPSQPILLPLESVSANVYGQSVAPSSVLPHNRPSLKKYGNVDHNRKRIDVANNKHHHQPPRRPSNKPKPSFGHSHRIHHEAPEAHRHDLPHHPSMQSGFVPVQLETTATGKHYGLNQSQNVWFKNDLYLPTVPRRYLKRQQGGKKKINSLRFSDKRTDSKNIITAASSSSTTSTSTTSTTTTTTSTTTTTTARPVTLPKDLSKLYYIPKRKSTTSTTSTTAASTPLASNSNVWVGHDKDVAVQESQRFPVYVHNAISTPKPAVYNQNVKVDETSSGGRNEKPMTIHSVMRNAEKVAEQTNNTDHTILSDVLRLIAQDVALDGGGGHKKLPSGGAPSGQSRSFRPSWLGH